MFAIKNWKTGDVLYMHKDDTLREASLQGVDLSWADLERKNLSGRTYEGLNLLMQNFNIRCLKGQILKEPTSELQI